MTIRHLTNAGIERVSVLGLGCGAYGSRINETDACAVLDAFVAAGGTLLDTEHVYGAWQKDGVNGGYGNSEAVIGRWLRSCAQREESLGALTLDTHEAAYDWRA